MKAKSCRSGYYWCFDDKKCKKIPLGYHIGARGYLYPDKDDDGNSDGNGNGKNGNGHGGSRDPHLEKAGCGARGLTSRFFIRVSCAFMRYTSPRVTENDNLMYDASCREYNTFASAHVANRKEYNTLCALHG